jgi:hypothetical protein
LIRKINNNKRKDAYRILLVQINLSANKVVFWFNQTFLLKKDLTDWQQLALYNKDCSTHLNGFTKYYDRKTLQKDKSIKKESLKTA